jgi:photosystem II stability/assembly factor-like uncharacterized protein
MRGAAVAVCVLLTTAAGCGRRTWEALPLGTRADFRDVWFTDALHGWIAGGSFEITGGLIGRTSDGGKTWRFVSNLTERERMSVQAVRFFDSDNGIAATDSGLILSTADAGENWSPVSRRGSRGGLSTLFFLDERRGWAAGSGNVISTDDAGETWTPASAENDDSRYRAPIRAVQFLDDRHGWVAGMQAYLARTADGGASWEPVATPIVGSARPHFWDLSFVDSQVGWVVGEEGSLFSTVDGGRTWTRRSTGLDDGTPGLTISAVRFIDRTRGWITGFYANLGRSLILHTDDAGANWRVEADITGEELYAIFIQGHEHVWAVGARVREGPQAIYRLTLAAAE